jgi:hypothetical protein
MPSVTVSLSCKPIVVRWARFKVALNKPVCSAPLEKVMPAPRIAANRTGNKLDDKIDRRRRHNFLRSC